ncbi:MAG TPA: PDZ domain-containing protein, partial [Saprospiraceae bacterium]|nr:PDZ domain-containing protein [Saprospiraceae bacterium]
MENKTSPSTKNSYQIAQPLLLSVMVAIGIFLGYKMNDKADGYLMARVEDGSVASIGKVDEVIKFIQSKYVDDVDESLLEDIAIETILSELDPHSVYIKSDLINNVNEHMNGSYFGLGLETLMQDDTVIVVKVLDNSPAKKSGIQQFDRIISIDTVPVAGKKSLSIDDVRKLLKGTSKSIDLRIQRYPNKKVVNVNIKPSKIKLLNAEVHSFIDETTGIIKVNQFSADTYKEFMQSLDDLTKDSKL